MPKKTYTVEFKQKAVDLVKVTGMSSAQVCQELGISISALSKWCNQFGISQPGSEEERRSRAKLNQLHC